MRTLFKLYVHLLALIPITPPAPDDGAAAGFPIHFNSVFGALLAVGMQIGLGIGALTFLFMMLGALKERPIRWAMLITEGIGIVALVVMLLQSNRILVWIAGLV